MADVLPPGIRTPEDIDKLPLPDYYKSMMKTYLANKVSAAPAPAPAPVAPAQDPTLGVPQYHGDPYTTAPVMITAKPPTAKASPAGVKVQGVVMDKPQSVAVPKTFAEVDEGVQAGLIAPDKAYALKLKIEKSQAGTDAETLGGYEKKRNKEVVDDVINGPLKYAARKPGAPVPGPVMDGPDTTEPTTEIEQGLNPDDPENGAANGWGLENYDPQFEKRLKNLDQKSAGESTGKYRNI